MHANLQCQSYLSYSVHQSGSKVVSGSIESQSRSNQSPVHPSNSPPSNLSPPFPRLPLGPNPLLPSTRRTFPNPRHLCSDSNQRIRHAFYQRNQRMPRGNQITRPRQQNHSQERQKCRMEFQDRVKRRKRGHLFPAHGLRRTRPVPYSRRVVVLRYLPWARSTWVCTPRLSCGVEGWGTGAEGCVFRGRVVEEEGAGCEVSDSACKSFG